MVLKVSATLPALVLLGEAEGEAPPAVDVAVDLLPLSLSLSPPQLQGMAALAAALPKAPADAATCAKPQQQAADAVPPPAEPGELPSPPEGESVLCNGFACVRVGAEQMVCPIVNLHATIAGVKAFGWAAWQYLTNEEANGAQTPAQQLDDLAISLTVQMQGKGSRSWSRENALAS